MIFQLPAGPATSSKIANHQFQHGKTRAPTLDASLAKFSNGVQKEKLSSQIRTNLDVGLLRLTLIRLHFDTGGKIQVRSSMKVSFRSYHMKHESRDPVLSVACLLKILKRETRLPVQPGNQGYTEIQCCGLRTSVLQD